MERRRAAVRERARLLAHQAATQEMLAKEEEVEAESEEEEESEYEEYSDSEDELGPRLKPVFVRKWDSVFQKALQCHCVITCAWHVPQCVLQLLSIVEAVSLLVCMHSDEWHWMIWQRLPIACPTLYRSDRITVKERERLEAEEENVEAARKKQEEERKKESQKVCYTNSEELCVR